MVHITSCQGPVRFFCFFQFWIGVCLPHPPDSTKEICYGDLVTRRSCDGDLVTEILWQKLPHTLIPIVFVKLCPPRTDGSCLARDTSTHTKLSSLPSLVLNLHDFGQLYHFWNSSDHQKIRSTGIAKQHFFSNTEKRYPYVTTAAAQQQLSSSTAAAAAAAQQKQQQNSSSTAANSVHHAPTAHSLQGIPQHTPNLAPCQVSLSTSTISVSFIIFEIHQITKKYDRLASRSTAYFFRNTDHSLQGMSRRCVVDRVWRKR